jgi:DNA (cytosine-5)-methyltransferase 1
VNELALFAGAGGGILGGQLLGWHTVCAVEWNAYAASVLCARQNDGLLPPFPIWDDVRTFDGRPWRGRVDVVSGGFPCQDISVAGKGDGLDGERSGLWSEMARIIGEVRPRCAFLENSPALTSRGLGRVLGDLAALGFDARWGVIPASAVGAIHKRERIWIAANANGVRKLQPEGRQQDERGRIGDSRGAIANAVRPRLSKPGPIQDGENWRNPWGVPAPGNWWATEPDVVRMVHGVPARLDRITALGNAQVPQCAAHAWRCLMNDPGQSP